MKRRSFLAGLLALPFAPLVLGKEEVPLSRQHQKAIEFGARYGTKTMRMSAEGPNLSNIPKYAFVVADTYAEARQYIERAKAFPETANILHIAVSLSNRMAYADLMGHKNCHIIVAGRVGRTYYTYVNLQKVKENARHRNTNWYYPPENSVMLKLHEGTTV